MGGMLGSQAYRSPGVSVTGDRYAWECCLAPKKRLANLRFSCSGAKALVAPQ